MATAQAMRSQLVRIPENNPEQDALHKNIHKFPFNAKSLTCLLRHSKSKRGVRLDTPKRISLSTSITHTAC